MIDYSVLLLGDKYIPSYIFKCLFNDILSFVIYNNTL